jgi:MSHA pilin protein MshC
MTPRGKKKTAKTTGAGGFTLLELIMVIVLLGIIAVVAAPRMLNVTSTNAGAFIDKLRADVRYAQDLAMTRNKRARVYFNGTGTAPAAGYAVVQEDSASTLCTAFVPAVDPASYGNMTITLNTGRYAGITVAPTIACLEYDSLGQPSDCHVNLNMCSATAGGMSVTVNGNGVAAGTITVTSQTGAVN